MRIGFLLGAGVSLPAGMPSTQQLTDAVLRVASYQLNQDEYFENVNSANYDRSWPEKKIPTELLLRNLRARCQDYFNKEKKSREVNYEDMFFAASQLEEHLLEEYENPAIEPFTKALLKDLRPTLLEHLVKTGPQESTTLSRGRQLRLEMREFASLACYYIRSVVMLELRGKPAPLNHLTCLIDAINDPRVASCDIFTLNHDLLIEEVLHKHGLAFVDGFGKPENGMAEWDPDLLEKPVDRYFLKLHGSINWVDRSGMVPVKVLTDTWEGLRDERGDLFFPGQADLKMLVGTFNKIRDYYESPYFDLATMFRRRLREIDWLVASGYSFGDKGINTALSEWMDSCEGRKILVLHARGAQCLDRARGAIQHRQDRMKFHESHLCESDWEDLRRRYID